MRFCVLCALLLFCGLGAPSSTLAQTGFPEADVEQILAGMTDEEKVGQLLMVGFGGTEVTSEIRRWIRDRKVGGVALFSRNIVNFEQTARFTRALVELAEPGVPVFVALDQEGGNVVRVKDGATLLPGNMALGATRDPSLAYVAGQALAIDLRLLGFNMNLAPVLDINSNPQNPVIGVRSYGEDPVLVGNLGSWYVRGQQEMGVVAVAKHFPGHGDTRGDSHFSMPAVDIDAKRLWDLELRPFRRAIEVGLDAVMTAHIALPQVTGQRDLPATLSPQVIQGTLRERMHFNGMVITDGLEMQGIVKRYGSGRAAVLAILAGADMPMILWTRRGKEEVYRTLLESVRSGEISQERLDASVRRILTIKARRGLFRWKPEPLNKILATRNHNPVHDQVAGRIAREAVTLVRNKDNLLPLHRDRYRQVLAMVPPGALAERLKKEPHMHVVVVPSVPSRSQRAKLAAEVARQAPRADVFLVAAINRYHLAIAQKVVRMRPRLKVALVSLSSPYYLRYMPAVSAYVCTYSYLDVAQAALGEALIGRAPMTGRLPISIPGLYPFGHRVDAPHFGGRSRSPEISQAAFLP